MTTSPVMSINDEMLAELEASAAGATKGNWCTDGDSWVCAKDSDQLNNGFVLAICEGPEERKNADYIAKANPATIKALLAHIVELKRDAERYRWLRDPDRVPDDDPCGHLIVGQAEGEDVLWRDELDRFIDAAMEASQ